MHAVLLTSALLLYVLANYLLAREVGKLKDRVAELERPKINLNDLRQRMGHKFPWPYQDFEEDDTIR